MPNAGHGTKIPFTRGSTLTCGTSRHAPTLNGLPMSTWNFALNPGEVVGGNHRTDAVDPISRRRCSNNMAQSLKRTDGNGVTFTYARMNLIRMTDAASIAGPSGRTGVGWVGMRRSSSTPNQARCWKLRSCHARIVRECNKAREPWVATKPGLRDSTKWKVNRPGSLNPTVTRLI